MGKGKANYFDKLSVANFADGKSLHYGGRGNALMAGGRQVMRSINGTQQIGFGSTDPPRTDEFCFDPNAQRWTSYLLKEEGYQRGFRADRKPNFSDSTLRCRHRDEMADGRSQPTNHAHDTSPPSPRSFPLSLSQSPSTLRRHLSAWHQSLAATSLGTATRPCD